MFSFQQLAEKYFHTMGILSLRYLVFAGVLFLVFYIWKRRALFRFKIQQKFPQNESIFREIGYSFLSLAVFAAVSLSIFILRKQGYTKIYTNFNDYSVFYFVFSVITFIVLHDTYFYWMHRFMHWKKIYRYVHKVHHLSTNPTPWAAFAFHPIEAFIEIGIVPLIVFTMPVHHYAILIWVLYQTSMNVMGHLGFEMYPSGFTKNAFTKWNNTSTHHNMHHKLVNCNYGLYFNVWDRLMGTNHPEYDKQFEQVATGAKTEKLQQEVVKPAEVFAGR